MLRIAERTGLQLALERRAWRKVIVGSQGTPCPRENTAARRAACPVQNRHSGASRNPGRESGAKAVVGCFASLNELGCSLRWNDEHGGKSSLGRRVRLAHAKTLQHGARRALAKIVIPAQAGIQGVSPGRRP